MIRCQQDLLYRSEATVDLGAKVADIQAFVDGLCDQSWFPSEIECVICTRKRTSREGSVGGWDPITRQGQMDMAPVHCVENYVLHELAHITAEIKYGSKSHDPDFAREYLELVYRVRGVEAWQELKAAFDRDGVCYDVRKVAT